MKIKYYIEFEELIKESDLRDLSEEELTKLTGELKSCIETSLAMSGFNLSNNEIKLEFDLEES